MYSLLGGLMSRTRQTASSRHSRPSIALGLRGLALALGCATASTRLESQSVTPPIAEYKGGARGTFTVGNSGLYPLYVTLSLHRFDLTPEGDIMEVPLDTTQTALRVRTSARSFRIPAQGAKTIAYTTERLPLPGWFTILASTGRTLLPPKNGMDVRIELPHVVYAYQKDRATYEQMRIVGYRVDTAAKRIRIAIENPTSTMGRMVGGEATFADGAQVKIAAGPIFPNSTRWFDTSFEKLPAAAVNLRELVLRVQGGKPWTYNVADQGALPATPVRLGWHTRDPLALPMTTALPSPVSKQP